MSITFPEESQILKRQPQTFKTLKTILHLAGYTASFGYIISTFLIQPLLMLQYERRINFSSALLDKLRAISLVCLRHVKRPLREFSHNGTKYVEMGGTQTSQDEPQIYDGSKFSTVLRKLQGTKENLSQFANAIRYQPEGKSLRMTAKLWEDTLDNKLDHLPEQKEAFKQATEAQKEIRELKRKYI